MLITPGQVVSLTSATGVPLYQFSTSEIITLTWNRELAEVSRCELEAGVIDDFPDVQPWLHWVNVWDETGAELYWRGPVQQVTYSRDRLSIAARDEAALLSRTRCPITKQWESADPAEIARELWVAMSENHRLAGTPVMRRDPLTDRFDFGTEADSMMLDRVFDDLVGLGLTWSVNAGLPVLGPAPRTPLLALGENDFLDDGLSVVRDGSRTVNDVLVRGADDRFRARRRLGSLNLQTLVNVDSLFGVSNADRAARQYLRYCSSLREAVTVESSTQLHPDVAISIAQLIPSLRVTVEAFGVLSLMELNSVEVDLSEEGSIVSVTLESVEDDLPELITMTERDGGDE
jgi:hypothetical protein